jgi:hypothetical protein
MKSAQHHPFKMLAVLASCSCLLFVPAAAGSQVATGGLLGTFLSPGQGYGPLEEEPLCVNTFLACQAACSELQLRADRHRPVLTDENEKLVSGAGYALVAALAATTAWALAHARRSQQTLRRREADLQLQLQGVKEQAWDLGRRAARGSRPASRASRPSSRADRVFSPPPPSGGPVGALPAQWPAASPSSAYSGSLNQQVSYALRPGQAAQRRDRCLRRSAWRLGSNRHGWALQDGRRKPSCGARLPCFQLPAYATPVVTTCASDSVLQGGGLPLPIAPTAVTSPLGSYAPPPALPSAEPSANGISMLVSEASLRQDTQGADQLHATPTSAANKDSPVKSPYSAAVSQQQQQSWGGPPAAQNSYSPSAGYQLPVLPLSLYGSTSGGMAPAPASTGYLHTPAASAGHSGFSTPPPTGGSAASVEQGGMAQGAQLASPAGHTWVNTSRGGGTPAAFSSEASGMSPGFSPMLLQQQARSPLSGGGCSALQQQQQQQPDPFTPASGSTTRSAGTNVHSIAGSCGGSVNHHSRAGGLSPPSSVTSAASGRSARNIATAPQVMNMMDTLEAMVHSAVSGGSGWGWCDRAQRCQRSATNPDTPLPACRCCRAQAAKKKAAQLKERETLRMHGSSMSGGGAAAGAVHGQSPAASGMSPAHSASRLSLV